jgi:hypothetical protein
MRPKDVANLVSSNRISFNQNVDMVSPLYPCRSIVDAISRPTCAQPMLLGPMREGKQECVGGLENPLFGLARSEDGWPQKSQIEHQV